jgi:KaiC/GvpD/RAD55 family RecA-like ATPase
MANVLIDGLKERIANAIKVNQSIGIPLPGSNYSDLLQALFEHMKTRSEEAWVYVSITKPYDTLVKQYEYLGEAKNIKFIDCISRAAGILRSDDNCVYIESPTMLEKLGLEIINTFKEVEEGTKKYLVIDSLSNLIIYNDPDIVTEFFYHIVNRTRAKDIHTISLAIEEEGLEKHLNRLIYLNDKILKVRDSFI